MAEPTATIDPATEPTTEPTAPVAPGAKSGEPAGNDPGPVKDKTFTQSELDAHIRKLREQDKEKIRDEVERERKIFEASIKEEKAGTVDELRTAQAEKQRLEAELTAARAESKMKEEDLEVAGLASDAGIPKDLVAIFQRPSADDYVNGMRKHIDRFKEAYKKDVEAEVNQRVKTPDTPTGTPQTPTTTGGLEEMYGPMPGDK